MVSSVRASGCNTPGLRIRYSDAWDAGLVVGRAPGRTARHPRVTHSSEPRVAADEKAHRLEPDVEALYRQHGPMVLRRCRALLRNEEAAVEAMHDVFVEVIRRRHSLHSRGLSSLLHTMATHVSLNHIRSRKCRPEPSGD